MATIFVAMSPASLVTSLRIVLSPIFFLLFTTMVHDGTAAVVSLIGLWALFAIIEATDFFDGLVARKTGSVTDTGKLFDPFADSFARLTYFLSYLVAGIMPGWVFLIVLYRDLGVSFLRLMAMKKGEAMAAQLSGKIKAWVYAIAGGAGLLTVTLHSLAASGIGWAISANEPIALSVTVAWWICAATAAWTMLDYALAYRRITPKA